MFNENDIRDVLSLLDWTDISIKQNLSIDFIREFQDHLDWYYIVSKYIFTIEQMKEFKHHFDEETWNEISKLRDLTPQMIYEFQDYLNWEHIYISQDGFNKNWTEEDNQKIFKLKYYKQLALGK